jgi:hypothetical protein
LAAGIPDDVANVVTSPPEQRTAEQLHMLHEFIANQNEQYLSLRQNLAKEKRPLPPDARLVELQQALEIAKQPIVDEPAIVRMRHDVEQSAEQLTQQRLTAVQDLTWALINTSEFLFNH